MQYAAMLKKLAHPQPAPRIVTAQIFCMVDEVRALNALKQQYAREQYPQAKKALGWAGRHLQALQADDYDTVDAICQQMGVWDELALLVEADEDEKLKDIDRSMAAMKKDDNKGGGILKTGGMALASQALGAGAVANIGMGATPDMTSSLGSFDDKRKKYTKRQTPRRLGTSDIGVWVQRLKTERDPDTRKQVLSQLTSMNNPAALPQMARIFVHDPDKGVRAHAKHQGRLLYWNVQYWYLTQDGTIEKVLQVKAAELGVTLPAPDTTQLPPTPPAASQSIDDILANAEKKRRQRGRDV